MKLKTVIVISLICIVGVLSVAYATLSKNLSINGTAEVTGNTWDVHIENATCTKTGSAVAGTPTISGTTIQIKGMTLMAAGDTATCTFDVKNGGSVAAKLNSITNLSPTIEGTGSTATSDANIVANNYTFTLTYNDNTAINNSNSYATIEANSSRTMKIVATYKTNNTGIPTNDVTIDNLGVTLEYVQK